ncbi:MAG: tetratricopeptide repeat protein [Lachnospiraceae bacterium]|nr:tetratricopeptide repeat protein [Lachnospiraceae bacterium]MDY5742009.1 tetratricopeptide repeat protein [Lachnospiraceae bacterium]
MAIYPCYAKRALQPFVMEYTGQRIYTLEELCYFATNHLTLLGEDVINEPLCTWIEQELRLPTLAKKLMDRLEETDALEDFVYLIVKEAGYLSPEEWKEIKEKLQNLRTLGSWQKDKQRADDILRLGHYQRAEAAYQRLLRQTTVQPDATDEELAKLHHNLAMARLYSFQYEAAVEALMKAYQLSNRMEHLVKALFVLRMMVSEGRYQAYIHENIVPSDIRHMLDEKKAHFLIISEQEVQVKADALMRRHELIRIHELLQEWKQAYLKQK